MLLSISVGVLDGLGLSMFLPLLQMANSEGGIQAKNLGTLGFIVRGIEGMGVSLTFVTILIVMCVFFALKGVAVMIEGFYQVKLQQYFVKRIRLNYISGINKLNYKTFVLSDVGQIQNTLTGEVDRLSRAYTSYFLAFQQGIMVIVYMAWAFTVDPQFALLVAIGGAFSGLDHTTYIKL
jgi:ABC-type transport system involved in cytochrome bd biosynthesis fused ATPase/permease subunit